MANSDDFDLNTFQNEVWNEYSSYRNMNATKNFPDDLKKGFRGSPAGCFFIPLGFLLDKFVTKVRKEQSDKKNWEGFEKEAYELRKEPEIRKEICHSITKLKQYEVLTEEKFVRILTATISQPKLVKKFVIPNNAVLYGIIAHQIFQTGVENYCKEL